MLLTIFVRLTHKFYGLGVVCLKGEQLGNPKIRKPQN